MNHQVFTRDHGVLVCSCRAAWVGVKRVHRIILAGETILRQKDLSMHATYPTTPELRRWAHDDPERFRALFRSRRIAEVVLAIEVAGEVDGFEEELKAALAHSNPRVQEVAIYALEARHTDLEIFRQIAGDEERSPGVREAASEALENLTEDE